MQHTLNPPPAWRLTTGTMRHAPRVLVWLVLALLTGAGLREKSPGTRLPEGFAAARTFRYRGTGSNGARLDFYRPTMTAPSQGYPALVVIHGGGWRGGSRTEYGLSTLRLVPHGIAILAVDYRVSRPGVPGWPHNRDDLREAVGWIRRNAQSLGVDRRRIGVLGSGAGGHLALILGTEDDAAVQAVISLYGPSDLRALAADRPFLSRPLQMLIGADAASAPELYNAASPVRRVSARMPPTLLIHGNDDERVPLAQSEAMAAALARAGVAHRLLVVNAARHGFGFQAGPRDLVPEILDFLDQAWESDVRKTSDPTSIPPGMRGTPAPAGSAAPGQGR